MCRLESGYLNDSKIGVKYKIDDSGIIVYDSERNQVLSLKGEAINNYIAGWAVNYRHWLQILDNEWINSNILKLSPRLKYAL